MTGTRSVCVGLDGHGFESLGQRNFDEAAVGLANPDLVAGAPLIGELDLRHRALATRGREPGRGRLFTGGRIVDLLILLARVVLG